MPPKSFRNSRPELGLGTVALFSVRNADRRRGKIRMKNKEKNAPASVRDLSDQLMGSAFRVRSANAVKRCLGNGASLAFSMSLPCSFTFFQHGECVLHSIGRQVSRPYLIVSQPVWRPANRHAARRGLVFTFENLFVSKNDAAYLSVLYLFLNNVSHKSFRKSNTVWPFNLVGHKRRVS